MFALYKTSQKSKESRDEYWYRKKGNGGMRHEQVNMRDRAVKYLWSTPTEML